MGQEQEEMLGAALTESLVYEESREDEATMRKVRMESTKEMRRDELEALNANVLEKFRCEVERKRGDDLREVLRHLCEEYAKDAAKIEDVGRENVLCPSCKAYHGNREWDGMCSRCYVVTSNHCGPSLLRVGRALLKKRKKLPRPPSRRERASGRLLLEQRLEKGGRKGRDVKPDGACQFRAVAHQLFDDERHHGLVRQRALDHLRTRKKQPIVHDCEVYVTSSSGDSIQVTTVGNDFDMYLAAMTSLRSWGDNTTLQALANVFRVRICLTTTYDSAYEIVIEPEREAALKEIFLGFHSEMHYISVVPK